MCGVNILDKPHFQTDTKHIIASYVSDPSKVCRVNLSNMTVVENPAALLGSASWNGAADYKTADEFHERATAFFAAVKWTCSRQSLRAFGMAYLVRLGRNSRLVTSTWFGKLCLRMGSVGLEGLG
jgi:hypothetical protein